MTQKVNWGPKIQRCFHGVWKEVISKVGEEKGERSEGQTDRYMHTCTRGMGEGKGEEERGKERVRVFFIGLPQTSSSACMSEPPRS